MFHYLMWKQVLSMLFKFNSSPLFPLGTKVMLEFLANDSAINLAASNLLISIYATPYLATLSFINLADSDSPSDLS